MCIYLVNTHKHSDFATTGYRSKYVLPEVISYPFHVLAN